MTSTFLAMKKNASLQSQTDQRTLNVANWPRSPREYQSRLARKDAERIVIGRGVSVDDAI